jgi:ABC-type glycerol-3-phosphate transport system permease component
VSGRRRVMHLSHGVLLVLLAAYSVFPIYMVTIESFKSVQEDVFGSPFYVRHPTLDAYQDLFEPVGWLVHGQGVRTAVPFLVWAQNTAIVFGVSIAIILAASLAAGYALGRLRPPGWQWWRRTLLATFLIPQTILFLPLYGAVFHLHLDDSLTCLMLIYPMLAIPFTAWLFSAYFQKLSPDIEDSAYIEGAGRFTAFLRILLPMSWPVLVAGGLFALGVLSNDFMLAGVLLPNEWHQTIAAGTATMDVSLEDLTVVASVTLGTLPILAIAAVFAGSYVRGLTAAMIEGA